MGTGSSFLPWALGADWQQVLFPAEPSRWPLSLVFHKVPHLLKLAHTVLYMCEHEPEVLEKMNFSETMWLLEEPKC